MKSPINFFVQRIPFRNFLRIELTPIERDRANESIHLKYNVCVRNSVISAILIFPAVLFLDTGVLINVLIPITMVSGTAWFAVSLASIKQKFEQFGLELTINMFDSFLKSLSMLVVLTLVSLNPYFFEPWSLYGSQHGWVGIVSGFVGTLVILSLIKDVFFGAIKYDMNDAMLTGQNEAAELFFRRSLSFLHSSAERLKSGKRLQVANYYIGLSFNEVFMFVKKSGVPKDKLKLVFEDARYLKENPAISQEEADKISVRMIEKFLEFCGEDNESISQSLSDIRTEITCIQNNRDEDQHTIDTRFAIIFGIIADLIERQGQTLFTKKYDVIHP